MSLPERGTGRRTLIADTAIDLVAAGGLRALTHRAVDAAAALPAGSTSYYFRTRTALISACYQRLAELDLADFDGEGPPVPPPDREAAAAALAGLLYRWLTTGRARQLARFELSLEAARNPELETDFHRAGQGRGPGRRRSSPHSARTAPRRRPTCWSPGPTGSSTTGWPGPSPAPARRRTCPN